METQPRVTKRKRPGRRVFFWMLAVLLLALLIAGIYFARNFNRLVADALQKSFNSTSVSDVYELKFERLSVNIFLGNISVYNVVIKLRDKPLHSYPYINSSFHLTTGEIQLKKVKLRRLFIRNKLALSRIEIIKPEIQVQLAGDRNILLPFADSTVVAGSGMKGIKRFIDSFFLKEFILADASFQIKNSGKQREFKVAKMNISLSSLMLGQMPGRDALSFKQVNLRIGEISGKLQQESLRGIQLKDYNLNIESLNLQNTLDTLIFHFDNFSTSMKDLYILTADSIFQINVQSVLLSYRTKSVKMNNLSFKPNISRGSLQKRYAYQNTQFSGTIDSINLLNINFDTLIYRNKIIVDEINLDKVVASVFKDKSKPIDKNRIPDYPGQLLSHIPIPLIVTSIKAKRVNIENNEIKPDGNKARVNLDRGILEIRNFTNLPSDKLLTLSAKAYIEEKAYFELNIEFDYRKPQFSFIGNVGKFNLPDLNLFFQSYTPVTIRKGVSDGITFSGIAYKSNATGKMKFLYHDLDLDLQLSKRAKWQNAIITFAANTYLSNSNPAVAGQPPREVQFTAERDMNRGFINIILKAFFAGMKETMSMSKDNRNAFQEIKKKWKLRNKK